MKSSSRYSRAHSAAGHEAPFPPNPSGKPYVRGAGPEMPVGKSPRRTLVFRLTPAVLTSTTTSSSFGLATGRSSPRSTSGRPYSDAVMTCAGYPLLGSLGTVVVVSRVRRHYQQSQRATDYPASRFTRAVKTVGSRVAADTIRDRTAGSTSNTRPATRLRTFCRSGPARPRRRRRARPSRRPLPPRPGVRRATPFAALHARRRIETPRGRCDVRRDN